MNNAAGHVTAPAAAAAAAATSRAVAVYCAACDSRRCEVISELFRSWLHVKYKSVEKMFYCQHALPAGTRLFMYCRCVCVCVCVTHFLCTEISPKVMNEFQ